MGQNPSQWEEMTAGLLERFTGAFIVAEYLRDSFGDRVHQRAWDNLESNLCIDCGDEQYTITISRGDVARKIVDPPWTPFKQSNPLSYDGVSGVTTKSVWVNSRYQVLVYYPKPHIDGAPDMAHLSIRRLDRAPIRDWRDLQRIKSELCGTKSEACELFPSEDRLADTANQYHLWCLEPGIRFPWGFNDGRLTNDTAEAKKELLSQLAELGFDPDSLNSKQRDWEEHHKSTHLKSVGPVWQNKKIKEDDKKRLPKHERVGS